MPRRETPKRLVIDCATGEQTVEELAGDDLAEHEAWADELAEAEARREAEGDPPTPVEELNAGIQDASSLEDVKAVFAEWSGKHRGLL